ncbi:MAG: dTMP kinase [Gammaproteobacteria bacterium]|nr:dTMP kinase [Gammaproteobacteria bacterium]
MVTTQNAVGRFITVEGIEGVGKSTNLSFVANELRRAGHAVVESREPGGTALGERIRDLLLVPDTRIAPLTELLLMFAARAAHLEEVIRPALLSGKWVVCDRFTDASHAYQGGGRGLPAATIDTLASLVQGNLRPDLTLLLDAPLKVAEERQAGRGHRDRFEQESLAFFSRVQKAYLDLAAREPDRVRLIDADRPLAAVQEEIRRVLAELN